MEYKFNEKTKTLKIVEDGREIELSPTDRFIVADYAGVLWFEVYVYQHSGKVYIVRREAGGPYEFGAIEADQRVLGMIALLFGKGTRTIQHQQPLKL